MRRLISRDNHTLAYRKAEQESVGASWGGPEDSIANSVDEFQRLPLRAVLEGRVVYPAPREAVCMRPGLACLRNQCHHMTQQPAPITPLAICSTTIAIYTSQGCLVRSAHR